jgi:hypothetical protein
LKAALTVESDILTLVGFGAATGLLFVLMYGFTLMWRDPRKETEAEKRRREKREKKEASKPK